MTDPDPRLAEAVAGRYAIEREIGRGGMATVYLARDLRHAREVAVKVLRQDLAAAIGSERFLREIRITAQLNHPHILPLLDSGAEHDLAFYVMPYVAAGSLRQRLIGGRTLPPEEVTRIIAHVGAALDHAHRRGVVHRDVKPENILLSEDQAIVADFGIARAVRGASHDQLTRSGFPLGTPGYMSPEQAAGTLDLDPRTDVFGLACVAYEMLIGATPRMWPVADEVRLGRFAEIGTEARERLDAYPGRVEQVLVRGLALRAGERWEGTRVFADALAAAFTPGARLPEVAVRDVIRRASEIEAEAPSESQAWSVGGIEQVAAQVGIPPAHVRQAIRELEREAGPQGGPVASALVTRTPTVFRKGRLVIERHVAGRPDGSTLEDLIGELQRELGFVGAVSSIGASLHWMGTKPGFVGRDVRATFTRRPDGLDIHLEEHVELRGASFVAPGWGAAGGALVSFGILQLFALPALAVPLIVLPLAIGGGAGTAAGIINGLARKYRRELEALADRLAQIASREMRAHAPAVEPAPEPDTAG